MQDGGFLPPSFLSTFWVLCCYSRNFYLFSVKNGTKVLPFKKKFLLLRCILSKVKNNIN